jgi:hypothetical protein
VRGERVDIRINSHPISFQLEHEREVGDVISSVSQWARERDLVFMEAHIDDMSYALDTIPAMPLESVKSINCIVQSKADVIISSLREGMAYSERLAEFIESAASGERPDESMARSVPGGIEWLADILISVANLLEIPLDDISHRDASASDFISRMNSLKQEIEKEPDGGSMKELFKGKALLFASLRDIFRVLLQSEELKRLVIRSIDSPDLLVESVREVRAALGEQVRNLSDAVLAYQTGKDDTGSENLQAFMDFIYRYLRTSTQAAPVFQLNLSEVVSEGISLEEKNARIHGLLDGILAALENNDIISLSDILEYEMKPELENLEGFLEALMNAIQKA